MTISFEIPQDIEQQLRTDGVDPSRQAKELYLMEQYRQAKITHRQLQEALDLSFDETEHLLKQGGLGQDLDVEEFEAGRDLFEEGQAAMIVVCDMGPLQYLVLMGAEHVLPQLFTRVLTPPVVLVEMNRPKAPEPVHRWAGSPPQWLEIKQPVHIEDIPALGRKGTRGDGDRAVISLAREEGADFVIMDDVRARREAKKRGCKPLWMLQVLDEAAERGFIDDVSQKLEHLERQTNFYVGDKARAVIEDMKQRDLQRKQAQE